MSLHHMEKSEHQNIFLTLSLCGLKISISFTPSYFFPSHSCLVCGPQEPYFIYHKIFIVSNNFDLLPFLASDHISIASIFRMLAKHKSAFSKFLIFVAVLDFLQKQHCFALSDKYKTKRQKKTLLDRDII